MKKFLALLYAFICISIISCRHHHNNISITYKDAEDYYLMDADFSKNKTRAAEYYMDRKIGSSNNFSFVNTHTNATLTLDDHTKFYLRKSPGHIKIKLNKDENSAESYYRIKSMCEGMKQVLTR